MGPALPPVRSLQEAAGRALRARVAGEDAADAAQRIWGAEGARWFSAEDPIWTVHGDASMFPGGVAALLLQSLHPQAMAGVAGHSGYKSDPWGRLQRTSRFIATTTYAPIDEAEAAIARVRSVHERVRGRDDRGAPYHASDPALLAWVHAAEAHSFLRAYQGFGREALSPADADRYVEQSGLVAKRLGADPVPRTVSELRATLAAFRPVLRATPTAREAARFLLIRPPLPLAARPGYAAIAAGGVSVLPDWARQALGLPIPPGGIPVARQMGQLATRCIRWAMAGVERERQTP